MQIAGRRFSPSWLAILLTVVVVALFVRLGVWQLDRAEQKRHLSATYTQGADRTLELTQENVQQLLRYQQVKARGHYDGERQILLDNMPSPGATSGRPGYHVWTLFRLEHGGTVLVNRGWVPMGTTRDQLPNVSVDDSPRTLFGRIDQLPQPGIRLGASVPKGRWPEVLYYPTADELTRLYGEPITARVLLLDPSVPDGYERVWQAGRTDVGTKRHIGYAVQWFALALAVVVVFIVVNLKKAGAV